MREVGDIIGGTLVDGEIVGGVEVKKVIKKAGMVILELASKYDGPVEPKSDAAINTMKVIVAERKGAKAAWREKNGLPPKVEPVEIEIIDEQSSQNGAFKLDTEESDF